MSTNNLTQNTQNVKQQTARQLMKTINELATKVAELNKQLEEEYEDGKLELADGEIDPPQVFSVDWFQSRPKVLLSWDGFEKIVGAGREEFICHEDEKNANLYEKISDWGTVVYCAFDWREGEAPCEQ